MAAEGGNQEGERPDQEEEEILLVRDEEGKYRGVLGGLLAVEIVKADITKETVDAITNAANGDLAHGGGVAGAISRVGGS